MDGDNRKKILKKFPKLPPLFFENRYIEEAKEYVKKSNTVGECETFADFQDAMDESNNPFLFHSNSNG